MGAWIEANFIARPLLEVAHIVGIALLLGNLVLVELRVWRPASTLPLRPLARSALPLAIGGFVLAAGSGLAMFADEPGELLASGPFLLKMVLMLAAGINAGLFHARDGLWRMDVIARAQTVLSLALWLAVIVCGRWIAYV